MDEARKIDPQGENGRPRRSLPAERAVRDNVIGRLACMLDKLASAVGRALAAPLAADLFFIIRDYLRTSPADPFADIAAALLDSLSEGDFWSEATAAQYEGAASLARSFLGRTDMRDRTVDRALGDLENLGFDITPFGRSDTHCARPNHAGNTEELSGDGCNGEISAHRRAWRGKA